MKFWSKRFDAHPHHPKNKNDIHSRPWLCYWMLHALDLLQGVEPRAGNEELLRSVVGTHLVISGMRGDLTKPKGD